MNHRYNTRRKSSFMKEVNLFHGNQEDVLDSLIKTAYEITTDSYGYRSTEEKDRSIRAVYSKLIKTVNTHICYFQLRERQKNLLSLFNKKAIEHITDLEKRKENKNNWKSQDLMRSNMVVGTIKTYLNNQMYIFKNSEAWLGKTIKKKNMPREIVALINSFAVGDYADKIHTYNEYYSKNSYYGM